MLPSRSDLRIFVYSVLLYLACLDWTNASVLRLHKRTERHLGNEQTVRGETETDEARLSRQTYHPWVTLNRTVTDKKTYCGQRLVESMKDICRWGRYNGPYGHRKRSPDYTTTLVDSLRNENIVNECCKQPCTRAQLRKYCGKYGSNPGALLIPQADARAESLIQEDEHLVRDTPAPPPPPRGDNGLSPNPFMLQLQDWYGTPRSSSIRNKYINFVPDYSSPTLPRRPIFNSNQRRVERVLLKQQGKPTVNLSVKTFQQAAPVSDETERDLISQEEALRSRPVTAWQGQPVTSPYTHSTWRSDDSSNRNPAPVTIPIGVTDQFQTYYA